MRWSRTPWIQGIYLQWKCATAAIPKRLDSTFVFRSQSHWSFSRRMLSTAPHSIFTICSPHLCTTGFVVIQQSNTDHSLVLALHKVITDRCVITCRCAAPEGGKSPLRPATAQKPSLPDTHTRTHILAQQTNEAESFSKDRQTMTEIVPLSETWTLKKKITENVKNVWAILPFCKTAKVFFIELKLRYSHFLMRLTFFLLEIVSWKQFWTLWMH